MGKIWFPSMVVIIATIYTPIRIWQLWRNLLEIKLADQIDVKSRMIIKSLLWLLILFWSANLVVIFGLSWPVVLA